MESVFSENEIKHAFCTKRRLLVVWIVLLVLTLLIVATFATVNAIMVYRNGDRTLKNLFMILSIVLTTIFGCGSVFFFGIKFRLTRNYCRMLKGMENGIKDNGEGKFLAIDEKIVEKDGVFFYKLVMECAPMKRDDITERQILVECNHSLPTLSEGDKIKFITHGNVLVAYEVESA